MKSAFGLRGSSCFHFSNCDPLFWLWPIFLTVTHFSGCDTFFWLWHIFLTVTHFSVFIFLTVLHFFNWDTFFFNCDPSLYYRGIFFRISLDLNLCNDQRDKIEVPDTLAVEDLSSSKFNNKGKLARLIAQFRDIFFSGLPIFLTETQFSKSGKLF